MRNKRMIFIKIKTNVYSLAVNFLFPNLPAQNMFEL